MINDSNQGPVNSFTIAATGKAFKILSDGLYSDKIRAIIRELSCNARDSHVAAGNTEQWYMHLPTNVEPWFAVEDRGVGLSHDDVINIYTRYFASTKTTNNALVGQLGLGSKSPFSYTNEFTVTSHHDGERNRYQMYIDAAGTPQAKLLDSGPTDHTGLRVEFSVPRDHARWRDKAIEVLRWFENPPLVARVEEAANVQAVCTEVLSIPEPLYQGNGWRIWKEAFWDSKRAVALMGGVEYPIDRYSITDLDSDSDEATLTHMPIAVDFAIGDLDVAASREGLSYDPQTSAALVKRLITVTHDLRATVQAEIDAADTLWAAKQAYGRWYRGPQSYALRCIMETAQLTYGATLIENDYIDINTQALYGDAEVEIRIHRAGYKSTGKTNKCIAYCRESTVVVFDDCAKGGYARARHWHLANNDRTVLVFHEPDDGWKALAQRLGNPPITWASSLAAPPKQPKTKSVRHVYVYGHGTKRRAWKLTKPDELTVGAKHYVVLHDWDAMIGDRLCEGYGMSDTFDKLRRSGLLPTGAQIYGIRRSEIRHLGKDWTPVWDTAHAKAVDTLNKANVRSAFAATGLWEQITNIVPANIIKLANVCNHIANGVRDRDSELVRFLQLLDSTKQGSAGESAFRNYAWMSEFFDIPMPAQDGDVPTEVRDAQRVADKYPMIKYMPMAYGTPNGEQIRDLVGYIDAVDASHAFLMLSKGDEP